MQPWPCQSSDGAPGTLRAWLIEVARRGWALLMPVIIIGGMKSGIFTPTEAAVVAAAYAMFISFFVHREMKLSDLHGVFVKAAKTTAMVMFLFAGAQVTGYMVTLADMPSTLSTWLGPMVENPRLLMAAMMVVAVAGFYGPNIFLQNVIAKRKQSIMQAFPDALDLMLICVEAGMSIEAAVMKVSQEIGSSSIPLAEELALLSAELSYLPERRMAYEGLARRTNHPGVRSVATAMVQAEQYGTPLGAALRVMAKENRDLRLSAAEKKAAALPAQLTVPMIVFFLPVLFIVILGPAIIKVQDQMATNNERQVTTE